MSNTWRVKFEGTKVLDNGACVSTILEKEYEIDCLSLITAAGKICNSLGAKYDIVKLLSVELLD